MSQGVLDRLVSVAELQRALRDVPQPEVVGGRLIDEESSAVVVVGAQPNVGTSTLAVALADALTQREPGSSVRLVDLAGRSQSGLLSAADRELGEEQDGWRLASRRGITVERTAESGAAAMALPALRRLPNGNAVVDAGRPIEELGADGTWPRGLLRASRVVLACAASVPGVRRAESALSVLPDEALVVAVGVNRWPAPVIASAGPLLRAAHSVGRTFIIPADKRLAVEGVDDQPMPKPVLVAATRLLDALTNTTPDRPKKGLIRWC